MNMNNVIIMGKIQKTPKIEKDEDGNERAIFLVEVERNYKNIDGKYDKDIFECQLLELEEYFKEDYAKGTSVAVKGKLNVNKKEFGENQIDSLYIDVEQIVPLTKNKNMSAVNVLGYLANDPELRETESGKKVTNIVIGTIKENKNDEPLFIRSTVWNGRAENVTKNYRKGDLVNITGIIRTNNRENENNKVAVTELVADRVFCIHSKNRDIVEKEENKEQEK